MILVTLGTHPKPMDRLVRALDDLLATGNVTDEVIITAAAYGYRPRHATALGIQPYDVLVDLMQRADVVITHGGPASIAMALAAGHLPIIVPRDATFGEHVDSHQIRFAQWLARKRSVTVVVDMDGLGGAIDGARGRGPGPSDRTVVSPEVIARLRSIIERDR